MYILAANELMNFCFMFFIYPNLETVCSEEVWIFWTAKFSLKACSNAGIVLGKYTVLLSYLSTIFKLDIVLEIRLKVIVILSMRTVHVVFIFLSPLKLVCLCLVSWLFYKVYECSLKLFKLAVMEIYEIQYFWCTLGLHYSILECIDISQNAEDFL